MSINRTKAIALAFLALLAAGSLGASTANAFPGPFWHHRPAGGKGEGEKIEAKSPEEFQGNGGTQILNGTLAGTSIEITAEAVQAKGIIYNNALQGQIKVLLVYHHPKLVKPELKECEVKVGTNNEVSSVFGHLMWKWDGSQKQLKQTESQKKLGQRVDGVALPIELKEGSSELPKGTFTTFTLSGAGCGVLAGTFEVKESQSVILTPENLEEWKTSLTTTFPGWKDQHWWNGTGVASTQAIGLTFGGNSLTLTGSINSEVVGGQEIAIFEK